eukprot:7102478-Prorocentrum_lima.AAC.1
MVLSFQSSTIYLQLTHLYCHGVHQLVPGLTPMCKALMKTFLDPFLLHHITPPSLRECLADVQYC